jgi:bifunctional non-homologous end joining protein LigD
MAGRVSRRAKVGRAIRRDQAGALPAFVPPQLTALTETPPESGEWGHELKWDGYRMHARIEGRDVRLLTRTGLDWTAKYPAIVDALRALKVSKAYLDGELCALSEEGLTSFSAMQAATDARSAEGLVFVLFDLLFLDGEDLMAEPLRVRKERLEALLANAPAGLQYSEHHLANGETFYRHACQLGIEGIVSKRLDCPYKPGDRGTWRKIKCLNREEFVVVGWTDPEGSRRQHERRRPRTRREPVDGAAADGGAGAPSRLRARRPKDDRLRNDAAKARTAAFSGTGRRGGRGGRAQGSRHLIRRPGDHPPDLPRARGGSPKAAGRPLP